MRRLFSAILCALLCLVFLTSCSAKEEKTPNANPTSSGSNTESPTGGAQESQTPEPNNTGDTLSRVTSVTGNTLGLEYYSSSSGPIGDYAAIDVSEFEPTGADGTLTLEEGIPVYVVEGSSWASSAFENIKKDDYLIVTTDPQTDELLWVTIIKAAQ